MDEKEVMPDLKHSVSKKLLWVDLEMTGLDPKADRILEVAALVTDFDFMVLDTFDSAIHQDVSVLDSMNEWSREVHNASGLIKRVMQAPSEQAVAADFAKFIGKNFEEPAVLAGNSIHQDRRFIREWWPEVDRLLHYRMLDVSSFKIIMQGKYGLDFTKPKESHRALDDIQESIDELKFYLQNPRP
jgi:oligoribonuclease